MPQYHWYAVDEHGVEFDGTHWATHPVALHEELARHGLTVCQVVQQSLLPSGARWNIGQATAFFEHLQRLISVGLLLEQALDVLSRHGSRARRAVAGELQRCVGQGRSLADTMALFPDVFDALVVMMVRSGQESAALPDVLARVVRLLKLQVELRKKVLNALYVPLMTIGFFIVVVLVIFVAIVPSLESVVAMANQKPAASLQRLFSISHGLHAFGLIGFIGALCGILLACWGIKRTAWWRRLSDWLLVHVPGVCSVYWAVQLSFYFQSIAVLMRGGLSLSAALASAREVTNNRHVRQRVDALALMVSEGVMVSQAYSTVFGRHASPEVCALLDVGHESSALAAMIQHAGDYYFDRVQAWLKWFVIILQPTVMIMLGLLVAALMYAVYMPIIQMPEMLSAI